MKQCVPFQKAKMVLYSLSAAVKRASSEQRTGCLVFFTLSAHAGS